MMVSVGINATQIGKGHRPYIIAEMSGNHNQSFDQAIKIVKAAKYAGRQACASIQASSTSRACILYMSYR